MNLILRAFSVTFGDNDLNPIDYFPDLGNLEFNQLLASNLENGQEYLEDFDSFLLGTPSGKNLNFFQNFVSKRGLIINC